MLRSLFWLLASSFAPRAAAVAVVHAAGFACERGCIVDAERGWAYEINRDDLVWTARAAHCEVESVIGTDDADAAMWALAQNLVRRHRIGLRETFAGFVLNYSGCTGRRWSSDGTRHSDRITTRADANRMLTWYELPQRTRDYVRRFLRGEIVNRWPGLVYVLTAGWERHADPSWVGPFYAATHGPRSRNAYWMDRSTVGWDPMTVQIVSSSEVSP